MYKIEITYKTGNSFGSHTETECLPGTFENLEIVKENCKRIAEHYKVTQKLHGFSFKREKGVQETIAEHENKPWAVIIKKDAIIEDLSKDKYHVVEKNNQLKNGFVFDSISFEQYIVLKADNGEEFQMSCFWIGYFEHLEGLKIVSGLDDWCDELFND